MATLFGVNMSKLTDLKVELELLKEKLADLISGGEDSLDTNVGQSTFTEATRAIQASALNNLSMQFSWCSNILAAIQIGIDKNYDVIESYDVDPEVSSELAIKRLHIEKFQNLFNGKLNIGADKVNIEKI